MWQHNMASFHFGNSTAETSVHTGASFSRCSPGDDRGASGEVEAFIWRCRQDHDRKFRYLNGGNGEMASSTVTAFLNMLTDVNTRCRAMEDQLTDLQNHAQRVASQMDSLVSHQGKQTAHRSPGATSASASSTADTMKAIRKLQWKIFDLQRENEELRAVLEMQRAKEAGEVEARHDLPGPPLQEDEGTAGHQSKNGSSWKRPGPKTPCPTNLIPGMPEHNTLGQNAQSVPSDTRVVYFVNSEDGVANTVEYPQEGSGYHPAGSGSNNTDFNENQQSQNAASGFNQTHSEVQAQPASGGFNQEYTSGCLKESATESSNGSISTPSRYPYTRWTSSGRRMSRWGLPAGRQAWRWTSHHPRLFPQVSTTPSTNSGINKGKEPRYQSTPKNPSVMLVGDTKGTRPHLSQTDEDASMSVIAGSATDGPCRRSDPCKEGIRDWDRNPYFGELTDARLEKFNLYATPEDIQLVQGTLELLNSINNLEYTGHGKE